MSARGTSEQEADRETTRGNLLHQVDLELREVRRDDSLAAPFWTPRQGRPHSFRKYCAFGVDALFPAHKRIARSMFWTRPYTMSFCCSPAPVRWTSLAQAVKRVAERAADAGLASDVLREVMQACAMSRKNVLCGAKAAGNRSDASSFAGNRQCGECDGAGSDGYPVFPPHLQMLEHFVLEFEKVVGNVEGVEKTPLVQSLVAAARAPA